MVATDNHPFWVPGLDEWVDAADLRAGQWLRTSAGTHVQISATRQWTEPAQVHNLTIDDIHTYYVVAGNTPVLVHNCNGLATLNYYPGVGRSGHFSIEVMDSGGDLEHMHLMPFDGVAMVGKAGKLPAPAMSHTFELPDASEALKYMRSQTGNQGKYNFLSNSCLTFCTKTLNAGGVSAPTDKAAIPWARKLFGGGGQ
ncbi:polymorphic toxin-type HINT domain-containing protein [Micromonospora tulbaghiae]|uniref:polymorphic toxin-type HINT domain-containing protein n=1 Tax=Micromonospora tulbaghiae TaxID=479978 RepID=UPI00331B93BD